jgi:endonuclease-8
VPEGDALHRIAERLRVLEGEVIAAEAPHPRAASLGVAERIDGRRLERVEAVGKNLLLAFEGGLVLRSHLRMRGRWHVQPAGARILGTPWLVLRGGAWEAVQRNGPVLELNTRVVARLGPDVMADPPDLEGMIDRLRATDQARELGEALLDQSLVAGIGNLWRAEALFEASTSPWRRLGDISDGRLRSVLSAASTLMRRPRRRRAVYRRAGLPCRRCGTRILSRPQGEHARIAYWCPSCQSPPPAPHRGHHQRGTEAAEA